MSGWFRFDLARGLDDVEAEGLRALAGIRIVKSRQVFAGTNLAWLAERVLAGWKIPYRVEGPPRGPQFHPSLLESAFSEMRREVSGLEVPWPGYLLPFQPEGLQRIGYGSGSLWWSPGSGKTLGEILWGLLHPGRTIVVTRAAARKTIAADIKRFTTAQYQILTTRNPDPIDPGTRVVVTAWETLTDHLPLLLTGEPVSVVWDEIHRNKNWKRRIAVPMRGANGQLLLNERGEVVRNYKSRNNTSSAAETLAMYVKRRLGGTASPIKDRLRDLWGQLDLVEPRMWGTFYDFARRFCEAHEDSWGGIDTKGRATGERLEELLQRLTFSVHNVPYSVSHAALPPLRRQVAYLSPDDLLVDDGKEAREGLQQAVRSGGDALAYAKLASAAARKRGVIVEAVVERCRAFDSTEGGTKLVVFSGLRKETEKLHSAVAKALPGVKTWFATGEHSTNHRDVIKDEFMTHPGPCVLVATSQTFGESINLHDCDVAIVAMLPFTPGDVRQIEGRFRRQGMRRPTLVLYFVAEGTYDETVAQMLIDKLPAVERVVGDEALVGFGAAIGGTEDEAKLVEDMLAKMRASEVEDDDDFE